jgi:hypothetical protein
LCHSWETDYPIQITSDEQLLELFELNLEKGVVHIHAQINDFNDPLHFSPTKWRCHPKVRKRAMETPSMPPLNDPVVEPSQPTQPKKPTNNPSLAYDYDGTMGVDDEGKYFDTLTSLSDSRYDTNLAASSDSDPEYDPEGDIVDEDDGDDVPIFSYDADDPCIDVGVVFQNTDECKSAVLHHAILNDHAFEQVKKDKKRFRAKCKRADKGCKWQIYASTSPKYIGCKVNSDLNYMVAFILSVENYMIFILLYYYSLQVKTCGPKHTCGSFNKCADTMASNKWVAGWAVEWLRDQPTMRTKELQAELKKKYKLDVPYDRVFRGKETSLDMINGKWDDNYTLLPNYQVELMKSMPSSVVEMNTEVHNGDV